MSFDISLERDGKVMEIGEPFVDGGTYAVGGTTECELNVTYNYAKHYPFRKLDGRTARETIPELRAMVEYLGTARDPDYWAPTPGNAGAACARLLSFAEAHPDAVWVVS